jgi:hypothetical protein
LALAKCCCLSPGGVFGSFAANKKQEQITEKPRNNNKKSLSFILGCGLFIVYGLRPKRITYGALFLGYALLLAPPVILYFCFCFSTVGYSCSFSA